MNYFKSLTHKRFRCFSKMFTAVVSRPRPSADRGSPGDAPTVGDWETVGRRGRAGQETSGDPARTSATNPIRKKTRVNRNFAACQCRPKTSALSCGVDGFVDFSDSLQPGNISLLGLLLNFFQPSYCLGLVAWFAGVVWGNYHLNLYGHDEAIGVNPSRCLDTLARNLHGG
jgi:hypothetical protein